MAAADATAAVLAALPIDSGWDADRAGEALDRFSGSVVRATRSYWAEAHTEALNSGGDTAEAVAALAAIDEQIAAAKHTRIAGLLGRGR